MTSLHLEFSRLAVSVLVPETLETAARDVFFHVLAEGIPARVDHGYEVRVEEAGWTLLRDGRRGGTYATGIDLLFALEEDLENALIARLEGWIGFHAGAVALGNHAIVTLGLSDTGKTSSTFQLIELGLDLVAEEVTPVDPQTLSVHPFPQVLTLSRRYAETFEAAHTVRRGRLVYHDRMMARYHPRHVRHTPVRLHTLLFPAYDPTCVPRLEPLVPGDVLTEVLRYCFPPVGSDEQLYDHVIHVLQHCQLWRVHSRDVASARALLSRIVEMVPSRA